MTFLLSETSLPFFFFFSILAKVCGFCTHVYVAIELFKASAQHLVHELLPVVLVMFSQAQGANLRSVFKYGSTFPVTRYFAQPNWFVPFVSVSGPRFDPLFQPLKWQPFLLFRMDLGPSELLCPLPARDRYYPPPIGSGPAQFQTHSFLFFFSGISLNV
jgi:hypothetical protein